MNHNGQEIWGQMCTLMPKSIKINLKLNSAWRTTLYIIENEYCFNSSHAYIFSKANNEFINK